MGRDDDTDGRRHVTHTPTAAGRLRPSPRRRPGLWRLALVVLLVSSGCGLGPGAASQVDIPAGSPEASQSSARSGPTPSRRDLGCVPRPSRCGYPDSTNTGLLDESVLRPSGSVEASTPGQVIEDLDVVGEINVTADDVTIRNTRVTGGRGAGNADWVVVMRPGAHRLTIVDSELRTPAGSAQDIACLLNLGDGRPTVLRADIHGCSAGVSSGSGTVADSYIHSLSEVAGLSHDVGVASNGGGGLVVRHNTILNQLGQTAAVALYQDFGPQSDDLIEGNLLAGGGYCVYGGTGDKGATKDIRILDNRFARHFFDGCGRYGPLADFDHAGSGNAFDGNYWDEDGSDVAAG